MSLNGAFEGAPPWRPDAIRDRHADAFPGIDPAEVAECRRQTRPVVAATVREIERYAVATSEELGALRDLELWGCNPFEED